MKGLWNCVKMRDFVTGVVDGWMDGEFGELWCYIYTGDKMQ